MLILGTLFSKGHQPYGDRHTLFAQNLPTKSVKDPRKSPEEPRRSEEELRRAEEEPRTSPDEPRKSPGELGKSQGRVFFCLRAQNRNNPSRRPKPALATLGLIGHTLQARRDWGLSTSGTQTQQGLAHPVCPALITAYLRDSPQQGTRILWGQAHPVCPEPTY